MAVTLEIREGIAVVTLSRPAVLNAMDRAGKRRLAEIWHELADDRDVRAVILTGEGGRAFCAGSDIKEIRQTGASATTDEVLAALPNAAVRLPHPVIAAINGICLGFGLTLALHCDLRVASSDATFGLPEVRQGMISALSAVLLPRLIPAAAANELLLLGETISADRAERIGLVSHVVPHPELIPAARAWAATIRDYPAIGVVETKRLAEHATRELRDAAAARVAQARMRIDESLGADPQKSKT